MIKIACIGDNVVDINYADKIIYPGGNCVNTAVYCRHLGYKSSYIGVLADDEYAKIITDSLDQTGVDYQDCVIQHGETGRCFCKLKNGDRILGDENDGGLVKSSPFQITDKIIEKLKTYDLVHTSCYSYLDDQLFLLKNAQINLLYDFSTEWNEKKVKDVCPNIKFALFSDKDGSNFEDNMRMLKDVVDQYHCELSILTMGTKGAYVYDSKSLYHKKPYNVKGGAIDTTGCGDSWITGFMTFYTQGCKQLSMMKSASKGNFIVSENKDDFKKHIIESSMCMGNLKARQTSQVKGAYGYGVHFAEFKGKLNS